MKPKEILLKAIENNLKHRLEAKGFKFHESQLKFKKKLRDGLIAEIHFRGSRYNIEDQIADFESNFSLYYPKYKKWCTENFPEVGVIGGGYIHEKNHVFKKIKNSLRKGFGYDFISTDNEKIMDEVFQNYLINYETYFDMNNSLDSISKNEGFGILVRVDFFLIQNNPKKALLIAKEFIQELIEYYGSEDKIETGFQQVVEILNSRIRKIENKNWLQQRV